MIFERKRQRLLLEGRTRTGREVGELAAAAGDDVRAPALSDLARFLEEWFDDSPFLTVHTSGSTGRPKELTVRKERMMESARMTCGFLDLKEGQNALLCMNLRYIGAKMMVVRALVAGLNLIVRPASGHPLADVEEPLRFAAMVPLQVYNTLRVAEEAERLKRTEILLIGGGAVDEELEAATKRLPTAVYSTYGMTETLSHIALRRLNGPAATDRYRPLPSVGISLSADETLVIDAPRLCDGPLRTNDIARLYPDGTFTILGRSDNVINSGGIKIRPEELERQLRPYMQGAFVITSVPDRRLGEAVVLLLEGHPDSGQLDRSLQSIPNSYYRPRHILTTERIPLAGNGKINRPSCRALAQQLIEEQ